MSTQNGQRKHGTTRGLPRRRRQEYRHTAMATGISRLAAKSGCAREWGGWGRIRDDGPGQNNPDRNEGPWGRAGTPLERRCSKRAASLDQNEEQDEASEGTKDGSKPHDAKTS